MSAQIVPKKTNISRVKCSTANFKQNKDAVFLEYAHNNDSLYSIYRVRSCYTGECFSTWIFSMIICWRFGEKNRTILCFSFQCILCVCAVEIQKRPLAFHERSNSKTTTATTTTTTTEESIYEEDVESEKASGRLAHLTLPSNATSIRSDISDTFSCEGRIYGYYADVDNDCQIFHVCLPVTYPDGREQQFRWSFICPEETTFNQVK